MPKRLSFIVIPHHKGRVFEAKVSLPVVYILLSALFVLLGINLCLVAASFHKSYQAEKLSELENENRRLEQKVEGFNSLVWQLKNEMGNLIQREKNIRLVFGLPEIDDDIREVGVGGPTNSEYRPGSRAMNKMNLAEEELDKVLRQSEFEKESFEEIYSQLLGRKAMLDHTPSIKPTDGYLSRGFGMKKDPFTGRMQFHQAMDLAADIGTPIYAPANGRVAYAGHQSGLGKIIEIDHDYGYRTVYAHLFSVRVTRGQVVKRGELIGAVGNSGYSTGPHLHYEVHRNGIAVDPMNYILCDTGFLD